jgi:uncharacterized protein (TIGR03118 family)
MWSSRFRTGTFAAFLALLSPGLVLAQRYQRTDLTTDSFAVSSTAANLDGNLVNAWGIARGSGSPWWISDNGTGVSTLYNGTGVPQALVVTIPTPNGTGAAAPTGTVFNATSAFLAGPGKKSIFLFVTEDGTISGWNPGVDATHAVLLVNRAGKAIYKGCAIAQGKTGSQFYATNFQSGRVEVFDGAFNRLRTRDDAFRLDGLGRDWSPFNIQNVGGNLVVTFAHRAVGSHDEDHGAGLGFAAVFDPSGRFLLFLQHGPWFNAPWGVALAPGDFGAFSHRLLVGNFGDGTIQAFNLMTGKHEGGMLDATSGMPLTIDGLWGISFGGGTANNGSATSLFFTAGPNDEGDGILGQLSAPAAEQPGNSE